MTQIEQLKAIIAREIKQKDWMLQQESTQPKTKYYFAGALAALRYIKFLIDKMTDNYDDSSKMDNKGA
jgi:hypothetical protein